MRPNIAQDCRNYRYLMYVHQSYAFAMLRPIQQEIWRRGGRVAWFFEGDEVNRQYLNKHEKQLNSIDEVRRWCPDAVLVPGNVVPQFIPGLKVGVFHGFPVGKMNRRGRHDHFEIRHCFDLYCTQGPSSTAPFNALAKQHGNFEVIETGWAMLDPLFSSNSASNPYCVDDDTRPTVLLCSTFSHRYSCAEHIFDEVARLSKTGRWRWLVQFHPKMAKSTIEKYRKLQSEHLQFVETDNVLPLLQVADVMLCDTSSVMFSFMLQQKPIVTFRTSEATEQFINVTEAAQLEDALSHALSRPASLMAQIQRHSAQLHPYQDGKSAARVVDAINHLLKKGTAHLKAKPLNLVRRIKQRKRLAYWRW